MQEQGVQSNIRDGHEVEKAQDTHPAASENHLKSPAKRRHTNAKAEADSFPQWLLNSGFIIALLLACACLTLSGWYLNQYLVTTNTAVEKLFIQGTSTNTESLNNALHAQIALSRFTLLSCGIMVGLSFGFLGFGLFLLGVKGEMEAEGEYEKASFKFARMAPGVFVILCATVLVAICVSHPVSITEVQPQQSETKASETHAVEPPDPNP